MDPSGSRKRKMKKPPRPPRAAKAQPPAIIRSREESKKIIEVKEEASEFRYMVHLLAGSRSDSSDSDHPSTSTSSSTFSDGREESLPVGILSPTPTSLPPVSPDAFTPPTEPLDVFVTKTQPPSLEELSVYDYEGWEEPATAYPFLINPPPSPNNSRTPSSKSYTSFNYPPFSYTDLIYPLPPIFKTPLPRLYYQPKFPDSN